MQTPHIKALDLTRTVLQELQVVPYICRRLHVCRFSLEPKGLVDPTVHVALHIQPWRLEPADRFLVALLFLVSLQVLIPGLGVLEVVC